MLPVLIYEPDELRREALSDAVMHVPGADSLVKVTLSTGSAKLLAHSLAEIDGVALVILGLALHPVDAVVVIRDNLNYVGSEGNGGLK